MLLLNGIECKNTFQAIGIYMWSCFIFAIASVLQTALVIYFDKLKKSIQENIKEDMQKDADVEKQLGIGENSSAKWNPMLTVVKFNIFMKRYKQKRKRSKIEHLVRDPKMLKVCVEHLTCSK